MLVRNRKRTLTTDNVYLVLAMNSSDLAMASGIGGGVGRCAPSALNPLASAVYVTVIKVPSGAVYEYDPETLCASFSVPGFVITPVS